MGRRQNKLCKDCNKDTGSQSPRCPRHAEEHKIKMRELRERRKKNTVPGLPELCPRCWERKKEPGLEACFQCAFDTELKRGQVEDWAEVLFPNFKDYVKKADGKPKVVTAGEKLRSFRKLKP